MTFTSFKSSSLTSCKTAPATQLFAYRTIFPLRYLLLIAAIFLYQALFPAIFDAFTTHPRAESSFASSTDSSGTKPPSPPPTAAFGHPNGHEVYKQQQRHFQEQQQQAHSRAHPGHDRSPLDELYNNPYRQYHTDEDPSSLGWDCHGYYCSNTRTCVEKPMDCPCPLPTDVKRIRGDWYICYRRGQLEQL